MDFYWNRPVAGADLVAGDHIYVYSDQKNASAKTEGGDGDANSRSSASAPDLAIHGIYIGDDEVVHFVALAATPTSTPTTPSTPDDATVAVSSRAARSHVSTGPATTPTSASSTMIDTPRSTVLKCSLPKFYSMARGDAPQPSDALQVRRYRYGVKRMEANYIASYGTCTTLPRQEPEKIVRVAKFYANHPSDFGEYEPSRNSEHFAVFCSTCDLEGVDDTSQMATPPALMVPLIPKEVLSRPSNAIGAFTPTTTKGKIAAAATATCGLMAAGTMWGVAPAVLLGGAVYASAKYVAGRQGEKEQRSQKKLE